MGAALLKRRPPQFYSALYNRVWLKFWHIYVLIGLTFAGIITVWMTFGGISDIIKMYVSLKKIKRDSLDDGTVVNHHNLEDEVVKCQ